MFPVVAGELIVRKDQSDTFAANPALAKDLADEELTEVVIAGMQGNYCVAESSRGAPKRRLQPILASGAHATCDENEPASAISARIERELAAEGVRYSPSARSASGNPHSWPQAPRHFLAHGRRQGQKQT